MSNYELKSRLNQLESQLRQAERVNAELRGELSTVERGVSRAHKELEDYNDRIRGTLDNCNGTMTSSHQRVIDAIEVQGEIERMYVRFKQMELANKKIRAANNKKYYDFANYRTVRKLSKELWTIWMSIWSAIRPLQSLLRYSIFRLPIIGLLAF